jgi:hypothetical protein
MQMALWTLDVSDGIIVPGLSGHFGELIAVVGLWGVDHA